MGKRKTSTTKHGKFMNPTDQARKEARKKELKKNKKQRLAVRTAVLKGKNPREIVQELEKLDDMEFNVLTPPSLNDKVLKDKRRKLHETWARVIKMYEKDNVEQYVDLKRLWHSYQNRKYEVIQQYEAVKNAQNVRVEEIPLPSMDSAAESIPLPPMMAIQAKSGGILKKPSSVLDTLRPKTCPGVPVCPPPTLQDYDEGQESVERAKKIRFDDEGERDEEKEAEEGEEATPQVDSIQKKMLQMAGQDIDAYMKEMEEVHRQTQAEKEAELQNRLAKFDDGGSRLPMQPPGPPPHPHPNATHPLVGQALHPPSATRPVINFRPAPPPLRPGMAPASVRLPPGPPPGRPSAPPGPPPGRPPLRHPGLPGMHPPPPPPRAALRPPVGAGGVVSAGPQINKESSSSSSTAGMSVIEAKPQMRNLKSDITRFVPTNVKVKRDAGGGKKKADPLADVFRGVHPPQPHQQRQPQQQQQTKDDAYAQFMMEMDQLMK